VERIVGIEAAGRYYVAYVVATLPVLAVQALNNAWSPLVVGAGRERWSLLADTGATVVVAAGAAGAAVAVAAPVLLTLSAPGEYQPDDLVHVVAGIAIAAPLFASYTASVLCLIAAGRTAALMWITPAVAVLNIALNLALLPELGLGGAAIATVAAYGAQAFLVRRATNRIAAVPWRPATEIGAFAIAGAGASLSWLLPTDWWVPRLLLALAIGVALLAVARRLLRRRPVVEPVLA